MALSLTAMPTLSFAGAIVSFVRAELGLCSDVGGAEGPAHNPTAPRQHRRHTRHTNKRWFDKPLLAPAAADFRAVSGKGVVCTVGGAEVVVGTRRWLGECGLGFLGEEAEARAAALEASSETAVFMGVNGVLVSVPRDFDGAPALPDD